MIKKTLFFGNPAYLSTKNEQLVVTYPDKEQETKTVAIEDIGVIVMENQQITITNGLLEKLTNNNVALINCDQYHLPIGLLMPLSGHTEQTERFRNQIEASLPLKKNLWQQTISSKISNQGALLKEKGIPMRKMELWAKEVTSGDALNHEARAAVYYWDNLFKIEGFTSHISGPEETFGFIERFNLEDLRTVIIGHGNESSRVKMAQEFVRRGYKARIFKPEIGQQIIIG